MSIGNLIVQRDSAYVITDSGYFRDDGTIAYLAPKSMEIEELSLAVATVGSLHCGYLGHVIVNSPPIRSQDEFFNRIAGIMRDAYDLSGLDPDERWSRLLIAFYSHKHGRAGGCTLWTSSEEGVGPADKEPWKLHGASVVVMPAVDRREVFGRDIDLTNAAAFNPSRDALPIIEAQRGKRDWDSRIGCRVAGDICLTAVSRAGIETTTLHSYPDMVGMKAAA
jgi:hypothetical protein